jgi:hypothetical protein
MREIAATAASRSGEVPLVPRSAVTAHVLGVKTGHVALMSNKVGGGIFAKPGNQKTRRSEEQAHGHGGPEPSAHVTRRAGAQVGNGAGSIIAHAGATTAMLWLWSEAWWTQPFDDSRDVRGRNRGFRELVNFDSSTSYPMHALQLRPTRENPAFIEPDQILIEATARFQTREEPRSGGNTSEEFLEETYQYERRVERPMPLSHQELHCPLSNPQAKQTDRI